MQVVKDHIKLTMTGPATAVEEGKSPEELQDSHLTVLVARHFEAMWAHMRQGLEALPAPLHRLMDQVCHRLPSCCELHCLTLPAPEAMHYNSQHSCLCNAVISCCNMRPGCSVEKWHSLASCWFAAVMVLQLIVACLAADRAGRGCRL